MDRLIRAIEYAERRHRGQFRKPAADGVPYITHPIAVANRMAMAGVVDTAALAAAILHDVIEDTVEGEGEVREQAEAVTRLEMTRLFGPVVVEIVMEVTDDWRISKDARREAQRTREYGHRAKLLKIADKTCNVVDYTAMVERHGPADTGVYLLAGQYADRAIGVVSHLLPVPADAEAEIKLHLGFNDAVNDLLRVLNNQG